jgi:hypothetical protein
MLYKSYKLLGKYEFQAIALGQLPQIGTHRVDLRRAAVSRTETRAAVAYRIFHVYEKPRHAGTSI